MEQGPGQNGILERGGNVSTRYVWDRFDAPAFTQGSAIGNTISTGSKVVTGAGSRVSQSNNLCYAFCEDYTVTDSGVVFNVNRKGVIVPDEEDNTEELTGGSSIANLGEYLIFGLSAFGSTAKATHIYDRVASGLIRIAKDGSNWSISSGSRNALYPATVEFSAEATRVSAASKSDYPENGVGGVITS